MNNIIDINKCTGCMACYNICPKGAIEIIISDEGFEYPKINKDKCINCGLCQKVCPILHSTYKEKQIKTYAAYNTNISIRNQSSSGGIFTLLAETILKQNGVVFGASYNDAFLVEHQMITNKKQLYKLRSSKYLQSSLKDSYLNVKKQLELDKVVLFTGTPCQIEGLKHFLNKKYDNLYTQDFICHGCPSPKLWKKYLNSYNKIVKHVNMRNKENGWNDFSMDIVFEDNHVNISHCKDKYMYLFLSNLSLRRSCYNCNVKTKYRNSDITLADFWGINNICPEMNDDKGASLIIVNSKKGIKLFDSIKNNLNFKEVDLDEVVNYNTAMIESCKMPKNRVTFFSDLNKLNFEKLYKKYLVKEKTIIKVKKIIKRVLNRF